MASCVFTQFELSNSSGLGLRKNGEDVFKPLDSTKIDAVRGIFIYPWNKKIMIFYVILYKIEIKRKII